MATLLTINGTTGLTFDESVLPASSNSATPADFTTDVVNTGSDYLHGYFEYTYDSGVSARTSTQDGEVLYADFTPGSSFPKADIDTWIANAANPPVSVVYICENVSDAVIPADINNFKYLHVDSSATQPFSVPMEWDGARFIPAQTQFTEYTDFVTPPTLNLVSRKGNMPTSGTLSFKVTQDPNQPGYDGITWYNVTEETFSDLAGSSESRVVLYDGVAANAGYLYKTLSRPESGGAYSFRFQIWDIHTDKDHPVLLGEWVELPKTISTALSIIVTNDFAYVLSARDDNNIANGKLLVFSISDKTNPTLVGELSSPYLMLAQGLLGKQGATLFAQSGNIGSYQSYISAIDVTDPQNPVIYGVPITIDVRFCLGGYVNGYLYMSWQASQYVPYTTAQILDVSNPNNIQVVGSFDLVKQSTGASRVNILNIGDYLYSFRSNSTDGQNLIVADISDPVNPVVVAIIAAGSSSTVWYNMPIYDPATKIAYITGYGIGAKYSAFRLNGADTKLLGNYQIADRVDYSAGAMFEDRIYYTYYDTIYSSKFIDLSITDKPLSLDLANDTTAMDQLNHINWLDQWGSNGYVTIKDALYTPTTRPTAQLTVLGSDGYNFVYYTNSSFPVDTIFIPIDKFNNQGLKNTGDKRVKGYLDIVFNNGSDAITRSSVTNNVFNIDLLPNATFPGDDITWWITQSTDSTHIPVAIMFVATGYENANPNPLRLLETDATGTVGFQYDPLQVPQDSSALSPSQVLTNIFNNADVTLTGYFDAFYMENGETKQASVEGNALTVDFQARDSYPRSSFQNWLATFPQTPYSVWYHVGTYQAVAPANPPEQIAVDATSTNTFDWQIADVPTNTNHLTPADITSDLHYLGNGWHSGYLDYVYDDNGTPRLASQDGNEMAVTFTPGSSIPQGDVLAWLNSASATPSEVFYHVGTYSVTDPNPGNPTTPPPTPVFDIQIPVIRTYTDGTTANDDPRSATYGVNSFPAEEYWPTGQTTTVRYYRTDTVASDITISDLDPATDYRLVMIGNNIVSTDFTTDSSGSATFTTADNVEINGGTLTVTVYDAAGNPITICANPQVWATSVRTIFVRNDGWCFYGTLDLHSGEIDSNATLEAGIYEKIIIRSQNNGNLIPDGTTFKLIKPGFTHQDLNAFLVSATMSAPGRELTITLPQTQLFPDSTSQQWELILTNNNPAPCGDGLSGIGDTALDALLVNQADGTVTFGIPGIVDVDPTRDTDADGITDVEEGAPTTDTDQDGVKDYRDFDSDNDGIPDFVEGTDDADADNIPAFQDPDEGVDHWYSIDNMPTEMVEMVNYSFSITHYAHNRIANPNMHVVIEGMAPFNFSNTEFNVEPGQTEDIIVMLSAPNPTACPPCTYPDNPLTITITCSYEDASGNEVVDTTTYNINKVDATDDYPYQGNIITWRKQDGAVSYNIYRKQPGELSYVYLSTVLANNVCNHDTQFWIDRSGVDRAYYQITAVYADGSESERSNAMRNTSHNIPLCYVQGVIVSVPNVPVRDVVVSVRLKKAPTVIYSAGIYAYDQSTKTDANGAFSIQAPQGSTILLTINDIGLREELLIPLAPAVDLQELLELNNSEALL